MKRNHTTPFRIRISAIICVIGISSLASCKNDDPAPQKTQAEKVTAILTAGTWTPASVMVDGADVTADLFTGFSIAFSESTFTTAGTSPVWLRQDTWSFKDEGATVIIRGQDTKEITIDEISDTQLKLSLEWDQTTYDDGRSKSLAGTYEFVLNK